MLDLSPGSADRRRLVELVAKNPRLARHAATISKCHLAEIVFRSSEDPGVTKTFPYS